MSCWKTIRISLLAATFGGVLLALGKSILYPTVGNAVTSFIFPAMVPLLEWQHLESKPLDNSRIENSKNLFGRQYRYVRNNLYLDIEMRYLINTNGDVKAWIEDYRGRPSFPGQLLPILRQQERVGFYSLFTHKERAYLSACINPRGGSTVTDSQFWLNRIIYDVRLNRLFPWLLSREEIPDRRCLWAHLSLPLKNSSPEDAYQSLEKVWFSWHQWWQHRFPKP